MILISKLWGWLLDILNNFFTSLSKKPKGLRDLRAAIIKDCNNISQAMVKWFIRRGTFRAQENLSKQEDILSWWISNCKLLVCVSIEIFQFDLFFTTHSITCTTLRCVTVKISVFPIWSYKSYPSVIFCWFLLPDVIILFKHFLFLLTSLRLQNEEIEGKTFNNSQDPV